MMIFGKLVILYKKSERKDIMRGKRYIAGILVMSMLNCGIAMNSGTVAKADEGWKYGLNGAKGWNSNSYSTIHNTGSDGKSNSNWRHALATANGELGVLESGDPDEDVFIYQNTKMIMDGEQIRTVPDIADSLDQQRKNSVTRENVDFWQGEVKAYNEETYGVSNHLSANTRPLHPGAQLRIKNNDYTSANKSNYNRYTNFETGEIGAQWKDAAGNQWNRRTFASREDDVIVTVIEAPEGEDLNVTLNIDNMLEMGIDKEIGKQVQTTVIPTTNEFVEKDENGYHIGQVGKYGVMYIGGKEENGECEYARGGYATAIRLLADPGATFTKGSYTRDIIVNEYFGSMGTLKDQTSDNLTVTGTNRLIMVSKVDNAKTGLQDISEVKTELYASLLQDVDRVINTYTIADEFSYDAALAPHAKTHGDLFRNVELNLCTTEEELADRELVNEDLIAKQSKDPEINKAFLERLYYNGRYASICSSGYATARLGGVWTGNWIPQWNADYTLDANVNLQVSGMNIGNLPAVGKAYIDFTLRHVADWEKNAKNLYGIEDAIMAPPRVDGSGNGEAFHMMGNYPFAYWNAGADWLLIPIYEYYQCYGNQKISVGKDIDIERLSSVLDLDEEDKARIKADGFDLLYDILQPLTQKLMNFWKGYVSDEFYVDSERNIHLQDGTTIEDGGEDAEYLFTPGYSPENVPNKNAVINHMTLAANTAMDIAAARDSVQMAGAIAIATGDQDAQSKIQEWNAMQEKFPSYLYESDGVLKEWALEQFEEQYNHRHVSHAYGAWPAYEAQNNKELRDGLRKAMDMRYKYNLTDNAKAHGHMHNALTEARLKRTNRYEESLYTLVNSGYQYNNLLTSHNKGRSSAFCTDNAIGLTGAVLEGLVYSNTGEIELLPTLIGSWKQGNVSGLMTRTNAELTDMAWDLPNKKVTVEINSNKAENEIRLMSGISWKSASVNGQTVEKLEDENGNAYILIELEKDETAKIEFQLADVTGGTYAITDGDAKALTPKNNDMAENNGLAMQAMTDTDLSQRFVMGTIQLDATNMEGESFDPGEYIYFRSVATPDCYIDAHGSKNYIGKDDGIFTLNSGAPVRYNKVFLPIGEEDEDGYAYIQTTTYSKYPKNSVLAVAKSYLNSNGEVEYEYSDRSADGVRITHQQKVEGDPYQLWDIQHHMGYVTIRNKATGKYMSAINLQGELCQKSPITTVVPENTQLWNIEEIDGKSGYYTIQNTYSGRYITESDGQVIQTRTSISSWFINDNKITSQDGTKGLIVKADGSCVLGDVSEATLFNFDMQKTIESGAVPDQIEISDTDGNTESIHTNIAETITLNAVITPVEAGAMELIWIVEDLEGNETADVNISSEGMITFQDTALGNSYYVYAKSQDGSCTSNKMALIVSNAQVREETIQMEDYVYGFGNYKNEVTNIGTINGIAVLKFEDISVDDLKSIKMVKSNSGNPSYVQFFLDATTDITSNMAYDGVYIKDTVFDDTSNNGPTAMKRYLTSHILDYGTEISDQVTIDASETERLIPVKIPDGITGKHDLYVKVNKVTGTWAGNFDYMALKYSTDKNVTELLSGDVNEDGKITAIDALLALKASLGMELTDAQKEAADVVDPEGIDVLDVKKILDLAVNYKG